MGIPRLREEQSDNYSFGFIWNPLDNLNLTVDYFQIDIEDRIVISAAISATNPAIPQSIRDILADNNIGAAQFFTNAGKTSTDGIEAVLSWTVPTDNGASLTGSYSFSNWLLLLRVNYFGTYTVEEGNGARQTFGFNLAQYYSPHISVTCNMSQRWWRAVLISFGK